MRLFLLGLLFSSSVFAQSHDLSIILEQNVTENQYYSAVDNVYMTVWSVGYELTINPTLYGIIGVSSGRGKTDTLSTIENLSYQRYNSFQVGIGFRF